MKQVNGQHIQRGFAMNIWRHTWARHFFIVGGSLLAMAAQAADPWPAKPIKIVIPFSAGGVQDTLARSLSNELGAALGQPVIVENRPGAGAPWLPILSPSQHPTATR